MRSVLRTILLLLPIFLIAPANRAAGPGSLRSLPRLTLWAWQMPEHLEFLDPEQSAVAYLDRTIYVGEWMIDEPRVQPMVVPPGTQVTAVVRIEMATRITSVSEDVKALAVKAILRSARRPGITALQIDFDAVKSQREFYREILLQIHAGMPQSMPLSITALASWCAFDDWIADLPIDEAVPMMFRMGQEGKWFGWQGAANAIREPLCRGSLGVSTDELWPNEIEGKRLYVFAPRPWTPEMVASVVIKAGHERN